MRVGVMKLKAFREGDTIPDGAKFVRAENRRIPGSEYERIGTPPTLLGFLGITERVHVMVKVETVSIYEVPE
jgi:hypothetical protein